MTKQTKLITGLLAGAALGAGIALILANDKDGELKERVSDWFADLVDSSKDKFASIAGLAKDTISKVNA